MNELNNHYPMLLGLDDAWLVKAVDLSMESKRVVVSSEKSSTQHQAKANGGQE
jgi:hypothetical protein